MTEKNQDLGGYAGGATGSAAAKDEDTRVDERNLEDVTQKISASRDAEIVTGFAPFRAWLNREIARKPAGVMLNYENHDCTVTEITVDGQLRLERDGTATLIPFDERYIPAILGQLLA